MWVLTGDKKETAINIGYSCKLLSDQLLNLTLDENSLEVNRFFYISFWNISLFIKDTRRQLHEHCQTFGDSLRQENLASLVIEGKTLKYALSPSCRQYFLDLAISCKTVICCR